MTTKIERVRLRRVEDMRAVSVKVSLARGEELELFLASTRVNDGDWSPPIVRLTVGRAGENEFALEDWDNIRDGIDRAVDAFRRLDG